MPPVYKVRDNGNTRQMHANLNWDYGVPMREGIYQAPYRVVMDRMDTDHWTDFRMNAPDRYTAKKVAVVGGVFVTSVVTQKIKEKAKDYTKHSLAYVKRWFTPPEDTIKANVTESGNETRKAMQNETKAILDKSEL